MAPERQLALDPFDLFCAERAACVRGARTADLSRPFVLKGHRYATNGIVAVRTPTKAGDTTGVRTPDGVEHVGWITDEQRAAGPWRPWPKVERADAQCAQCKGAGTVDNSCPECDGSGVVECEYGHEHECEECDGHGRTTEDSEPTPCPDCIGGKVSVPHGVRLAGRLISGIYAALIGSVDAAEYLDVEDGNKPLRFRFGAVDGLVLPLSEACRDTSGMDRAFRLTDLAREAIGLPVAKDVPSAEGGAA